MDLGFESRHQTRALNHSVTACLFLSLPFFFEFAIPRVTFHAPFPFPNVVSSAYLLRLLLALFSWTWERKGASPTSRLCQSLPLPFLPSPLLIVFHPDAISAFFSYFMTGLETGAILTAWPVLSKKTSTVRLPHGLCVYPLFLFTTSFFTAFAKPHSSCLGPCY